MPGSCTPRNSLVSNLNSNTSSNTSPNTSPNTSSTLFIRNNNVLDLDYQSDNSNEGNVFESGCFYSDAPRGDGSEYTNTLEKGQVMFKIGRAHV